MKTVGPLFLLLICGLLSSATAAAPPNVVFIISDDHHYRDYGFMGHKQVRTPHLDRLAAESLVFTRGHVPSSLCRPSLATMFTGLYPHQHKITSNDPPLANKPKGRTTAVPDEFYLGRQKMIAYMDAAPTLAKSLGELGYVSFQTGKWWEGDFRRGGFSDGMTKGTRHGDAGLDIGRKTMQPMYDFVDAATKDGKPFFLWYAPMLPHSPHNPPERLLAKHRDAAPNLETAKYWACIDWLDESCGELVAFLDQRKLTENTLIVYLADNGWLQDPTADKYAPKSKQSQYEGGLRTPILLKLPGKIAAARRDELVSSIDLAPTILALAGGKPVAEMQGVNLLDEKAVAARKRIFGECFEHNAVDIDRPAANLKYRWCIEGTLKLIAPNQARVPDVIELYDLAADPDEEKNLATERPADVRRLQAALDEWWNPLAEMPQKN